MEVIDNTLRYVRKKKKKKEISNKPMTHIPLLCQLQLSISQNRPVQLVPCFVGVHHVQENKKIYLESTFSAKHSSQ